MKYPLPDNALLRRYEGRHYTDCFSVVVPGTVSHQQFIQAFYKTWLFRLERLILKWAVKKPSSDDDVDRLASGEAQSFAAWTVEDRAQDQLLLCDFQGNTRSWLMVEGQGDHVSGETRLFFGSAVIKNIEQDNGTTEMGQAYRILLGFHKLYSRALLKTACHRLRK